jgi:hypothetical protein
MEFGGVSVLVGGIHKELGVGSWELGALLGFAEGLAHQDSGERGVGRSLELI